ncbi:MAG: TIM barrel protein [Candidatus Pacearchaeota archaeon]|nr:TIM barrel protein [Candidatus Pacearchaeota archaeon]
MIKIRFGPAGLGPVKEAIKNLENYHKLGLRACEIAFTYQVYIGEKDAEIIGKKAKELDIELSIHAPYYVNLNSIEKQKREATKNRIIDCCRIGNALKAGLVVFHPGYYGKKSKEESYEIIKKGIIEIKDEIRKNKWDINIAPETMGKINVFGSIDEISRLVKETDCSFCIDFAHVLAREKKVDFEKINKLFPQKKWHVHFSGIIYNEKGERNHRKTKIEEWKELLKNLPKEKDITIINESPNMVEDSVEGLKIYERL